MKKTIDNAQNTAPAVDLYDRKTIVRLNKDIGSKNQLKGWLYLAPALLLLLIFSFYPLVNTFRMAFLNGYNGLAIVGGESFSLGIENFKTIISNPDFTRPHKCLL